VANRGTSRRVSEFIEDILSGQAAAKAAQAVATAPWRARTSTESPGSIPPTFYELPFCTKVFCTAFLYSQLGFVIFCQKIIGAKAARKMLVKCITGSSIS